MCSHDNALRRVLQVLEEVDVEKINQNMQTKLHEQKEKLQSTLHEYENYLLDRKARLGSAIRSKVAKQKRKLRLKITGQETMLVREYITQIHNKAPVIRFIDKIAFTTGVLIMALSEFVVLKYPDLFWLWFLLVIPTVFVLKFQNYRRLMWQYFLIDFCYFANLSCLLQILLFPAHSAITKLTFFFCNGPVAMAIPVWRNSLVFHDADRLFTTYIHFFPVLLSFTLRWFPTQHMPRLLTTLYEPPSDVEPSLGFFDMFPALLGYTLWQGLYLLKTEVLDKEMFEVQPDLQTSFTWLVTDTKNAMHQLVLKISRKLGLVAPNAGFNPHSPKTKVIFVVSQLIYTWVTFIPALFLHRHLWLHVMFVCFLFSITVHNGASYYIEVFSRNYANKFERRDTTKSD